MPRPEKKHKNVYIIRGKSVRLLGQSVWAGDYLGFPAVAEASLWQPRGMTLGVMESRGFSFVKVLTLHAERRMRSRIIG